MNIFKSIVKSVRNRILDYRVKRAVRLAKMLSETSGRRYLVLMVAGIPKVYSKRELKDMIRRRKFVKGTTIQELEKRAIVVT